MTNNELLNKSFKDFQQDFEELEYLVSSNREQLEKAKKRVHSVRSDLYPQSYKHMIVDLNHFSEFYRRLLTRIHLHVKLSKKSPDFSRYSFLLKEKNTIYDLLRTQQGIFASVIVSLDFQSPSFLHSKYSQAGAQTGKIIGNINDYKRDVHLDAKWYEDAYKKEFIDARFKFNIYTYLANSGMAAFTTILNFLLGEKKIQGYVLVGKSSYFQYKYLLQNILGSSFIEVDENNTYEITSAIDRYKPSAIFLDSLCNSPDVAVCDIPEIIAHLIKHAKNHIYLIIDTTCTSLGFHPWNLVFGKSRKVHLITFESLNKYHQFGMDRVTAGIINVLGMELGKIYYYREDCGTIISDASVYALPIPNRKMLQRRLSRLERNALLLTSFFKDYNLVSRPCIKNITFPRLENHPSFALSHLSFWGSFFTLQFHQKYQNIRFYKKFVRLVIEEAKRNHADIVSGTSFGLNSTRIYHVISHVRAISPFIRISAGTQDRASIEKIKKVFEKVLK